MPLPPGRFGTSVRVAISAALTVAGVACFAAPAFGADADSSALAVTQVPVYSMSAKPTDVTANNPSTTAAPTTAAPTTTPAGSTDTTDATVDDDATTDDTTADESSADESTGNTTEETTSDDATTDDEADSLATTGIETAQLLGAGMILIGIGLGMWWFGGDLKHTVASALLPARNGRF